LSHFSGQHASLNSGSLSHALHGIDTGLAFMADEFLEETAHHRHSGWTAYKHQPVDLIRLNAGIVKCLQHRLAAPINNRPH
jgi:hypothetical protein